MKRKVFISLVGLFLMAALAQFIIFSCSKSIKYETQAQMADQAQMVDHLALKTYEVWVISIYETNVEANNWQQAREKAIKNWKKDTTSKKGHWDKNPAIQGQSAKAGIIEIKKKDAK